MKGKIAFHRGNLTNNINIINKLNNKNFNNYIKFIHFTITKTFIHFVREYLCRENVNLYIYIIHTWLSEKANFLTF